jgi:cation transporter-like permease
MGDPSRARRDVEVLMTLLRWGPAVIVVVGAAGVLLGLVGLAHESAEVRLMGASLVLGVVVLCLLALIATLWARVAVARWDDPPPPAGHDERRAPARR